MNIFNEIKKSIVAVLEEMVRDGLLPSGLDFAPVTAEPPRDSRHGDVSSNAAMVLAKTAGVKPRDLAEALARRLEALPDVELVEIAGPGFINLRLKLMVWGGVLRHALKAGASFGDSTLGEGVKINIEYVSANPTGPMHVGHGRGACFGDVLARLLSKTGYAVTKEYYVNDAGSQMQELAKALRARYLTVCGVLDQSAFDQMLEAGDIQYGGDYLIAAAQSLKERDGRRWVDAPEEESLAAIRDFGIERMMALIRDDLQAIGIEHDVFSSERALVAEGEVEAAARVLGDMGLLYVGVLEPPKGKLPEDWEPRPQTLFKAAQFGDDVDRPLKKSDGSWTYFASDIAYHRNKIGRGFNRMINVLGADHGGYVKRMQAAVSALSQGQAELDVKLCQLVRFLDRGTPVKMSKRAGTFVTLREVVDHPGIGKDVFRFLMLTRRNDMTLDFDFAKATEQSKDNPVFYVQYAHARAHSVRRHFAEVFADADLSPEALAEVDLSPLTDSDEIALMKLLAGWPRIIESAAEAYEPHRIAYALYDVASSFHALWNKGRDHAELRFLLPEARGASLARLALVWGAATVIASGLSVLGVAPLEEMR